MSVRQHLGAAGSDANAQLLVPFTQLNIVVTVDVVGVLRQGTLTDRIALMDNSPGSTRKGTAELRTACRQSQVLNWLIYPIDDQKREDGSWPPFARISNIVFVKKDGNAEFAQTCLDLCIYGGPDAMRKADTPVYTYWAGIVRPELLPGIYDYRLIIECDTDDRNVKKHFELNGPSLEVLPMGYGTGH